MAPHTPTGPYLRVIFNAVGQGDCTLIVFPATGSDPPTTVLIDCGSTKDARCAIDQRILPSAELLILTLGTYVKKQGVGGRKVIDHLIITHPDADHYNLVPEVLRHFDFEHIVYTCHPLTYSGRRVLVGTKQFGEWLEANPAAYRLPANTAFVGPKSKTGTWDPGEPYVEKNGARLELLAACLGHKPKDQKLDEDYEDARCVMIQADDEVRRIKADPHHDPKELAAAQEDLAAAQEVLEDRKKGIRNRENNPNADSAMMLLTYQKTKVFLMGDALGDTELALVALSNTVQPPARSQRMTRADDTWRIFLKVSHHGSTSSTVKEWVQKIKPDRLVISAGTQAYGAYETGMPSKTKLGTMRQDMISATGSIAHDDKNDHAYVFFDDDQSHRKFAEDTTGARYFTTLEEPNPYFLDHYYSMFYSAVAPGSVAPIFEPRWPKRPLNQSEKDDLKASLTHIFEKDLTDELYKLLEATGQRDFRESWLYCCLRDANKYDDLRFLGMNMHLTVDATGNVDFYRE